MYIPSAVLTIESFLFNSYYLSFSMSSGCLGLRRETTIACDEQSLSADPRVPSPGWSHQNFKSQVPNAVSMNLKLASDDDASSVGLVFISIHGFTRGRTVLLRQHRIHVVSPHHMPAPASGTKHLFNQSSGRLLDRPKSTSSDNFPQATNC